jgi:MFS family permease
LQNIVTDKITEAALGQCLALLRTIGDSFGLTNPSELSWLIAGYSLTVGTFILVSGRIGDVFGYKNTLLAGFAWFSIWSMIAGLSVYSSHVLLIFARIFEGIGAAIILPNGIAILGASYAPGPRKAMVFSLFGACAPGGSIVGAAFASLFGMAWWPWAFFSFAMALAFLVVISYFVIPDLPRKAVVEGSLLQKLKQLDLLGATVGITALVLINFAWNQAPIVGWQKAYVYLLLILGITMVPVFFFIELRIAPRPLIPFDVLTCDVGFVLGCVACGWACFGVWVFYSWQFLQILREASPLLVSAWFSPVVVSGALASLTTGWLLCHVRPALVMVVALSMFTLGTALIATAPVHQTYWAQTFLCTLATPWGMDMSFPAATLILSNAVQREHQGIAASLVATVINYSISLGLGFATTVEVHVNDGGKTHANILKGYRAALFLGVGLASLGLLISIAFLLKSLRRSRTLQRMGGGTN